MSVGLLAVEAGPGGSGLSGGRIGQGGSFGLLSRRKSERGAVVGVAANFPVLCVEIL